MLQPLLGRIAAVCCLVVPLAVVEAAEPDLNAGQDYRAERKAAVTYDVELAAVITAPYHTEKLRVWLPIPPSDAAQEVMQGEWTVWPDEQQPQVATEPVYGNRFAYFEFAHPQGAQIIRHRFRVTTHELYWHVEPAKVVQPATWPASFDPYLRGDQTVVVNEAIQGQARAIVGTEQNAANHVGKVLEWMHATMRYDHGRASLAASSLHALTTHTGHCSDYHGLCSAFGRALGSPTRVTYGLNLFPKNSPSHCKLEVYLPPYGWVSFDVSETQRLMQAIGKDGTLSEAERQKLQAAAFDRLKRGFRDNTWLLQTRGTGYDLAPPAKNKVNVVRTLYAEADGKPLPEPDPADPRQDRFAWQIGLKIQPDKQVRYPFAH